MCWCVLVQQCFYAVGDASPTRVAAQVVSGIGFLGGCVILRQGSSVRGLNTAAIVGSLIRTGFLFQAIKVGNSR